MAEPRDKKFDDALRRMLNTPPDHKPRTKTGAPSKGAGDKTTAKSAKSP